MNDLQKVPSGVSDFGHDFSYAVWTPNSNVLLSNVSWGSDYKDVVWFDSVADIESYLREQTNVAPIHIKQMTYLKMGSPIRIDVPFNTAAQYNYLMVSNPAQPISNDRASAFFYFIQDVRYIAPNTTELVVQLDAYQTFSRYVSFGNCFVERGHIGIANKDCQKNYGRDYLTIPEGFDLGSDYQVNGVHTLTIATSSDSKPIDGNSESVTGYDVILATTVCMHELMRYLPTVDSPTGSGENDQWAGAFGTIEKPKMYSACGQSSNFEGLPNGVEFFRMSGKTYTEFLTKMSKYPWITQGFSGVWVIPRDTPRRFQTKGTDNPEKNGAAWFIDSNNERAYIDPNGLTTNTNWPVRRNVAWNWRDKYPLPVRYRHLHKFKTHPYTVVELTTYTGTPLLLKPENMQSEHMAVTQLTHLTYPAPRIVFTPDSYNKGHFTGNFWNGMDSGEFLDMTTGFLSLPSFSVVNNSFLSYMASNANTIAYQHNTADWSQQRALAGNQLSYNQASAGISLNNNLAQIGVSQNSAMTSVQNNATGQRAFLNAANSVANGGMHLASGGGVGAAMGALVGVATSAAGAAIDINQSTQQTGISNASTMARAGAQNSNAAYNRDTNKEYADFAAQGDYANTIAAINAKVQDAKMIQPTTAGQIAGDAFNLSTTGWQIVFKVKGLQEAPYRAIGEYWLRYGYAVNAFINNFPARHQVMDGFTYWKCRELYVRSATCPESYKQALRGIFEKGVTVWNSPHYVGAIDMAANNPLKDVTIYG